MFCLNVTMALDLYGPPGDRIRLTLSLKYPTKITELSGILLTDLSRIRMALLFIHNDRIGSERRYGCFFCKLKRCYCVFLIEIALARAISPFLCSLMVCRPSHSCTLLKPFNGFTCHLAGTLVGSNDTLC